MFDPITSEILAELENEGKESSNLDYQFCCELKTFRVFER